MGGKPRPTRLYHTNPPFVPPSFPSSLPPQSKLRAKAPFSQYAALEARGAKILFGNPADPAAALPAGATFDVVLDNNGKDLETCQPLIDAFKVRGGRRNAETAGSVWCVFFF